jgi:hypothetical protein
VRLGLTDHEKKNSVNSSNFRLGDSWIDSRQPLQPDYPMDSASMGERERERERVESLCEENIQRKPDDGVAF